jgi:hypothetical protein
VVKLADYTRMTTTRIITILSRLSDYEKNKAWAVLSKRAHSKDNVTGAISNDGPKERRK